MEPTNMMGGTNFWDVISFRAEMPTDSTTLQARSNFNRTLLLVGIFVIAAVMMGTFYIAYKRK